MVQDPWWWWWRVERNQRRTVPENGDHNVHKPGLCIRVILASRRDATIHLKSLYRRPGRCTCEHSLIKFKTPHQKENEKGYLVRGIWPSLKPQLRAAFPKEGTMRGEDGLSCSISSTRGQHIKHLPKKKRISVSSFSVRGSHMICSAFGVSMIWFQALTRPLHSLIMQTSWPLNNTGLKDAGPLIHDFFFNKYGKLVFLPYDFNNIFYSLTLRIQYGIHITYKMYVSWLYDVGKPPSE